MPTATTRYSNGVEVFTADGWTVDQWDTLYEFFTTIGTSDAERVASWLRNPRRGVGVRFPISPPAPAVVMDVFTRHGKEAARILTAVSVGASERFAAAFFGPRWVVHELNSAVTAWQFATQLGLDEPQATGWALTDYIHGFGDKPALAGMEQALSGNERTVAIHAWVRLFGPDAWLWPLAGFTLVEAANLRKTKMMPTGQQLRVMAALNGHTLPAGI